MSSYSCSSLPPSRTATTETSLVTTRTNATTPQQPILIASKPNACVAANEQSLSASPTAVGTLLTPPNTPSPVFNSERSSSNSAANNGRNLLKNIHPINHDHHPHQQRAYEHSIPLNPSPKNQNYSKKPSGNNPVPNNLVQDATATDDGEEPIAIDRCRRKGSYKKRKKLKKREKHN